MVRTMKWLFGPLACLVLTAALLELSLPLLHGRYASTLGRASPHRT